MIILPWFDSALSPNARTHWAKKAAAVKSARTIAYLRTREAGFGKHTFAGYDGRIDVWIDFYAKTRRYPDGDNALAACKAYLDGIADALGVNDSRFVHHPFVMNETFDGGKIVIRDLGQMLLPYFEQ